jgi:serine/threonine-protein kinase HipA
MISKSPPQQCYVYITLPGHTDAMTAGRFEIKPDRLGNPRGSFVYAKSYLGRAEAVPFDPIELKLVSRVYQTSAMNGVFGALRDASPDYWGRRIIERYAGKAVLTELDYLLESPDDRAGALGFGLNAVPPAPKRKFNQTIDLAKLQATADAIVRDEDLSTDTSKEQIAELLLIGTSMGGARPKAVVEDDDALWVAKFNRSDDKWNTARVEHAMLSLARASGVTTAESKVVAVGTKDVLLVKRFDREKAQKGYFRARMVSALTLLRSADTYRSRDRWSYIFLVEELRRASAEPKRDAAELFRRMCFNALISNTDDHPRNHALIARDQNWRLSPAYDLVPMMHISLEHRDLALICGDEGRFASARNLLTQAPRFLLDPDEAAKIIGDMSKQVRETWRHVARGVGVTDADCDTIAGAFVYPGFATGSVTA